MKKKLGLIFILMIGIGMIFLMILIEKKERKEIKRDGIVSYILFSYSTMLALKGDTNLWKAIHPVSKEGLEKSILKEYTAIKGLRDDILGSNGDIFSMNEETMIHLNPKKIMVWDSQSYKMNKLKKMGYDIEEFQYGNHEEDLKKWLKQIGSAIGEEKKIEEYKGYWLRKRAQIKRKMDAIEEYKTGKKILYFYRYTPYYQTISEEGYQEETFKLLKLKNVVKEIYQGQNAFPRINMEMILKMDPEIILITGWEKETLQHIYKDNRLKHTRAVKERQLYRVPVLGYRWDAPSHENPLFWIWLGKILYKEDFQDIDLKEEIREATRFFYPKIGELSIEEIKKIIFWDENFFSKNYTFLLS